MVVFLGRQCTYVYISYLSVSPSVCVRGGVCVGTQKKEREDIIFNAHRKGQPFHKKRKETPIWGTPTSVVSVRY